MLPKRVFLQPSKLLYASKKILNKQFNFYSVFGFPLSSRGPDLEMEQRRAYEIVNALLREIDNMAGE
jgi:hypothetical protein